MEVRNKLAVINEIIKDIYYIDDYTEMRKNFVRTITSIIHCKWVNYFLAEGNRETDPPVSNMCLEECMLKYLDEYEQDELTSWFYKSGKSMVYREKDVFDMDEIENSDFYRTFCIPANLHDALLTCLSSNGQYAGLVTLWKERGDSGFEEEDVFIMDILKTHLEARHEIEMRRRAFSNNTQRISLHSYIAEYGLTVREVQILEHLLAGETNEAIGFNLSISTNTVKKHVFNIYRKLGISSRSELIKFRKG